MAGDLEAALKLAMGQKQLADVDRVKVEMRAVLESANESGRMREVLDEPPGVSGTALRA